MTISLGRRLPGASSDLPGGRHGSGQSADTNRARWQNSAPLPPYLVLLPVGFAEPGRSPGLLVSSYLAVSPLPRGPSPRGGLFSVALSLPVTGRWALPTTAPCGVRTFLRGMTPDPSYHGSGRRGGHPACHDPLSIICPFDHFSTQFSLRRRSRAFLAADLIFGFRGDSPDLFPKFPISPRSYIIRVSDPNGTRLSESSREQRS